MPRRLVQCALLIVIALCSPHALAAQQLAVAAGADLTLLGVPIGSVLPYMGPLDRLPPNWQPADGRMITDPESPFVNQRLPNLMDNRFVMGVAAAANVNRTGGRNDIPGVADHTHPISFAGYAQGEINYARGPGRQDQFQMQYRAGDGGGHNHGGENRPAYVGVWFIVRIK